MFSNLTINDLILPNRIVVAPMCQYAAIDGCPSNWHYGHLSQFLTSGAGMLTFESTAVSLDGRITTKDLSLASDDNLKTMQKLFSFLKSINNMPICIQISHAVRKGSSYVPWVKSNTA